MANVDTGWFQGMLIDKGLSQRQLARAIGLDPSAVSLMLRGKRKMDVQEAGVVAKALGVSVDEVLRHAGVAVERGEGPGRCAVVGWVDDQGLVHDESLGVVDGPRDTGLVCLRVQAREVMDGWLLFYREISGVSLEAVGRLCVVGLEDGRKLLRPVRRGYGQGEFVLGGWWNERSGSVRLVSAAPVLWMRQ